MDLIYQIDLSLYANEVKRLESAKQGDNQTRTFKIRLIDRTGEIFQIPLDATANYGLTKPDGKTVLYSATIVDNQIVFTLTKQALTAVGDVFGDVSLNLATGEVLSSQRFVFYCAKTDQDASNIQSDSDFEILDTMVAEAKDARDDANLHALASEQSAKASSDSYQSVLQIVDQAEQSATASANSAQASATSAGESADSLRQTKKIQAEIVTDEEARVQAETLRVNEEQKRATAESARVLSEEQRVASENLRDRDEETRQASELERGRKEEERLSAEETRISSETARVNAEKLRITAEDERVLAESERKTAEDARKTANETAISQEASRVEAETLRASAESSRDTAEQERIANEKVRVTQESNRVIEEGSRATEEQKRVDAENARLEAERLRVAEEEKRVTAESARATQSAQDHQRAEEDHAKIQAQADIIASFESGTVVADIADIKTQKADKTYVDERFQTLVGTAPEALDTLGEIAEKLSGQDDAVTTLVKQIATKESTAEVDRKLLAQKETIDLALDGKANKTDVASSLAGKVSLADYETDINDLNQSIGTKADQQTTQDALNLKLDKAVWEARFGTNTLIEHTLPATSSALQSEDEWKIYIESQYINLPTGYSFFKVTIPQKHFYNPGTENCFLYCEVYKASNTFGAVKYLSPWYFVESIRETSGWNHRNFVQAEPDKRLMTTAEGKKLAGLENYVLPDSLPISKIEGLQTALDNAGTKNVATKTSDGLMSLTDKVKLDGVEEGATKTEIVDVLNSMTGTKALSDRQGALMKLELGDKANAPSVTATNLWSALEEVINSGGANELTIGLLTDRIRKTRIKLEEV